jgi:hypothetical protein
MKGFDMKRLNLIEVIEIVLGYKGHLVSASKSRGPAMAIYNSNLVINEEVIWYGDIDLHSSRLHLVRIAAAFGVEIEIYSEHSVRVFSCEAKTKSAIKKLQETKIKESTPVWTSKEPNVYAGMDYLEVYTQAEEVRIQNIKDFRICYKFLTPNGTEWNRFNTLYYNGPHRIYRIIRKLYYQFIRFPYEITQIRSMDNGKFTSFKWIYEFFKAIKREFGYAKIGIKNGSYPLKDYFNV